MRARVALRNDGGYLSVPVLINGRMVSLIVDTGSDSGLLTPQGVQELGLPRDEGHGSVVNGMGTVGRLVPNFLVSDLRIGDLGLGAFSVPQGVLPGQPQIEPPIAGLLGGDILEHFDVELDVPGRQLCLWSVHADFDQCAAPPHWVGGPVQMLPLDRRGARGVVPVTLDGQKMTALLDSGARSRIVSLDAARRVGVGADMLAVDPGGVSSGIDLRASYYHWHKFATFTVGQTSQAAPVLTVAAIAGDTDMLLGSDWFAGNRVWISYSTDRVFFQAR